ncbi:hypothetical protein HQ393_04610 [Chitinibacter bivalviorum]|uniref:Uncharacterized protein n=1 Tax=Chitinibacter bivalviorum TaxID=2739434 RepID=A0A7H9BFV6_9NEIS|nr:hypothetical protein [Chitinibacter bivalviorum]QLG87593.1 hypothetical protein HQ393_04610 [Chitinibacter bivalviorum]
MDDVLDLSFIKNIISDASKGYIYEKYGVVSDSGKTYFRGQNGGTFQAGTTPEQAQAQAQATNFTPWIIGGVAILALVLVMD